MYPFESSVATNRGGKLTASASSGGELVHTDDKHHLKKDYWVPSKSMPSEGRQSEWTIRAIYLIGFVDLFGVSMIIPLLPKLINNLGASRALAGLIASLYGAIQIFSSPLLGKISDIHGRKKVLILSYAGPFLGYVVMGLSYSLVLLTISRIVHGLLKHGLSISKAYLADIASSQERQSVLGMFNACSSFGFIFGPLISGYLADRDPTLQLSVLTGAGIFGMNFILVAVLLPSMPLPVLSNDQSSDPSSAPDQPSQIIDRTTLEQVLHSLNIFRRIHVHWWQLLDVIIIQFLLTFSSIIFKFSFVVFMDEQFHVSGTTLGQILSFNGLASALGSATSGRISKLYSSNSKQVAHFTLLLALSLTCLTFAPNIVCIVLLLIPLSLSTANLRTCLLNLMLQRGRAEEKGAIVGLANSISSISRMLAPSIVGISQEYSVRLPGYLSAGLALAASGVALVYCWGQDKQTTTDKTSDSDTC